ncbi:hypothetical protein OHB26_17840 [Nocardia sp. NBC_01503]|uniref:hypothetical protein n=1 Tax=Nocardia sp. NBC_01503 TaxID=2975997 RepID=UPI002E7BAB16|nr:hypothetical protein [Nocardia sp. NBC_01503]WTL35897.1 hypothetical protein OHB26_17840 [Nocardia sp. NBC_01503]
MNGRTLPRRAAAVAAIAATAVLGATSTATAEPKTDNPVDAAITHLTAAAGTDQDALAAVTSTAKSAQLVAAAGLKNIGFTPFGYQAPTLGCGFNLPFTMTAASAVSGQPGPDTGLAGPPGTLRFQAAPATIGMPLASGLSVAWLNVGNGRSGITPLDELTEYNLPTLAKTVDTGPGTVVASLWGSIDYPGSRCLVLPTVGLFTVADLPVEPAPAPTDPAQVPTTPAQAPADTGAAGSGSSDTN